MRFIPSLVFALAVAVPSSVLAQKIDLGAYGKKLKAAVAAGEMSEKEALAKWRVAEQAAKSESKVGPTSAAKLLELAAELHAMVQSGKMTDEVALQKLRSAMAAYEKMAAKQRAGSAPIDLKALGRKLKDAVDSGEMTAAEAKAAYARAVRRSGGKERGKGRGKGKKMGKGKSMMAGDTFYAIFIGRLKSKDIELGEFQLDVDHITSIYGDRSRKAPLLGKTVTVKGVSGPWLDKLLLIKKGETLKLRSMTLEGTTLTLSSKATVLEKTLPFSKDTYPIPPEAFRGFRGMVTGKVQTKSEQGYELILRVDSVGETFAGSRAKDPKSVVGRLMEVRGFYDGKFRTKFDDLKLGDTIQLGVVHSDRTVDSFDVSQKLETVTK